MIKGLMIRRILGWIGILLFILFISTSICLYISTQSKIKTIDATLTLVGNFLNEKSILSSISYTLSDIFNLATIQVILFFITIIVFLSLLWFVFRLYLIEKRNALIDPLTGFYNNWAFRFSLKNEVERARKFNHPLSLAIIDLDNFKNYNSLFGYSFGDMTINKIAKIIRKSTQNIYISSRINSDKFSILFPETNYRTALKICEDLRIAIEQEQFQDKLNKGRVTVSIGLAEYSRAARSKFNLFEEANKKLYFAKLSGKNRVK